MKAIVHIGTEKTGTTSIQRYLYLNREKLRIAGYHFVQSAGDTNNRALPAYCVADEKFDDFFKEKGITTLEEKENFKQTFIKQFEAELESLPKNVHTVIVSSEHFHSRIRTEVEMDNVYNLLSVYFDEVKIICYLREQVATCISYYSTHLKNGGTESFGKFLQSCNPISYYYNYSNMLANWERCFGFESLDVSLFSKDHFLNRDLLNDFTAKIDRSLVGKLNQVIDLENESLKPAGQILARWVNLVFPLKSESPEIASIREKCKKLIASRMKGKGQQPDLETWDMLFNRFADSNEEVRQKYFPQIEKMFAVPVEVQPAFDVVSEDFSELLIDILTLIKKESVEVFMPEVYDRLWSAISTCVNDVANVRGVDFYEGRPPPVVLGDADAHLLKNLAKNIEKRNPQAAIKLLTLASRVKPQFPAIQKKLEEMRKSVTQKPTDKWKSKFILTYHKNGDLQKNSNEIQAIDALCSTWLQSLDTLQGSAFTPVKNTRVVKSDCVSVNDGISVFTGYTVFQAESLDEAIKLAKGCPLLELGATVEVSEIGSLFPLPAGGRRKDTIKETEN